MNRKIRVTIIAMLILISFTITSFAANSTVSTQTASSSDANLSNLGISPNDFSGFKENKTNYEVSVPNNVTEVEVYATKKSNKATVSGTGKLKLVEGENKAEVVVTAEDGTKKTYTINIKRLKSGEKETTSTSKSDLVLESLEIEGCNLEPSFDSDVHQYTVNYDGSEKKLEISAKANKADSAVSVVGNENLINGKNIVTIIVMDSKENSVSTYQINLNKNLVEQEELISQLEESEKEYQIKVWIKRILIAIVVVCILLLLVVIHKKRHDREYKKSKEEKRMYEMYKKEREKGKKELEEHQNIENQRNTKHKRKH